MWKKSGRGTPKSPKRRFGHRFAPALLALVLVGTVPGLVALGYVTTAVVNTNNCIQTGTYSVSVSVVGEDNQEHGGTHSQYTLEPGAYTVTVTPTGTVQQGYCTVKVGQQEYNTGAIPAHGYTFAVYNYEQDPVTMAVQASWGMSVETMPEQGVVVGQPSESTHQPAVEAAAQPTPQPQPSVEPEAAPSPQPQPSVEPEAEPDPQPGPGLGEKPEA